MRTKLCLSLIAAAVMGPMSLPAIAADVVRPAPTLVRPAAPVWTGFYLGLHGGGGWGDKTWSEPTGSGPTTGLVDAQGTINGILGGAQAGFNFQLSPTLVTGVEADISWANIHGTFPCFDGLHVIINEPSADHCGATANLLGTIVGRAGANVGNALVYVVGGAAWVRDEYTDNYYFPSLCVTGGGFCATYHGSEHRWGWTIGAGVEYAISANWSAKGQYNFMDFGTRRVSIDAATGDPSLQCPCHYEENIAQRIHTVTFGLNYRFR